MKMAYYIMVKQGDYVQNTVTCVWPTPQFWAARLQTHLKDLRPL